MSIFSTSSLPVIIFGLMIYKSRKCHNVLMIRIFVMDTQKLLSHESRVSNEWATGFDSRIKIAINIVIEENTMINREKLANH